MINAIATEYEGIRFRSRTEARWAVLLDYIGVPWRYEHEGFELRSGRYLPDFWLPTVGGGTWLEIKGEDPTETERLLCCELAEMTKHDVFLAIGLEGMLSFPATEERARAAVPRFYLNLRIAGFEANKHLETNTEQMHRETWTYWYRSIFVGLLEAIKIAEKHSFWDPSDPSEPRA